MGEDFDSILNSGALCMINNDGSLTEIGKINDIHINLLKENKLEDLDTPFKSFSGEIQITKFRKSKGLRKLFLEMGRMINYNKYLSHKRYLKRVKNRQKLYNKLKKLGRS